MERLIYSDLLRWKQRKDHKPLILLGARQVGKTYILQEFGKREFKNVVYVNCHNNSFAKQLFRDFSVGRIIDELCNYHECSIVPGETLLVLDEIQEIHNGLAALKYFCEDMRQLHVAVAGSLLGISLREDESYPVGKVTTMRLYPMTFVEFLLANGRNQLCEMLMSRQWDSVTAMDELLASYLRQYFFTGGMPEAVKCFVDTHDVAQVREIQTEILDAYERDIAKHTKPHATRIHQVWESIPAQLARENKKFAYSAVKKGGRAADFELAIQWLVDAGVVCKVERVKKPMMPMKFFADNSAFKLFLLDCGLLACMAQANPHAMLLGTNAMDAFKGAFTENYVLQQMRAVCDSSIFYFSKDNSTMEVDFLYQTPTRVVPVEVKSGVNVKAKSFSLFINEDFKDQSLKGVRFSMQPYINQGWMENVPLYGAEAYLRGTMVEATLQQ